MSVRKITYLTKQFLVVLLFLQAAASFAQTPTFSGYSPTTVTHRTSVVITGANFTGASSVRFNTIAAESFTVNSGGTQITAVVPALTGIPTSAQVTVTVTKNSTPTNAPSSLVLTYRAPVTIANSGITRVVTNWNGYWSSTSTSTNPLSQPDLSHSLVAFQYGGVLYTTGNPATEATIGNTLTTGNVTGYTTSNFRSLPINAIQGNVPTSGSNPNLIVLGSKIDGSTNTSVPTAPSVTGLSVRDVLIDGYRGLNLGTGVTNLPSSSVLLFEATNILTSGIGDAEPDILVSQVATPSDNSYSVYSFIDANGNIVGNPVQINYSAVTAVGTYKTDFFTLPAGQPLNTAVVNGVGNPGGNTRDIRLVAYKLSDFGITEANKDLAKQFKVMPSGTSDPAFMAYNRNTFQIPAPVITGQPVSQAVCPGGSASFTVTVSATGTEVTYQWEKNGVALTNGNGVSGAQSATLTISPVTAASNGIYRCLVTNPAGSSLTTAAYLNTVVLSATGGATCQNNNNSQFVEVGAQGNTPVYQWYSNATNSNTGGTLISGANASIYYPPTDVAGTKYYYAEVYPSGFACATVKSEAVPFEVSATSVAGTPSGNQTLCSGSTANITLTGSNGTIRWQQSANGTSGWTNVTTGTGFNTANFTTAPLTVTTYYRAVVANGTCGNAVSTVVAISVAESFTWTGAVSIDWNTGGNWSCGTVPTLAQNVVIPALPTNQPTVSGPVTALAKSLTIDAGASLNVVTGASIHVVNQVTVAVNGTVTIQNNAALVQDNNTNNSGIVTVKKNSNPLYRLDYTMWSSPVAGQKLNLFSPFTVPTRFYKYDGPTDQYATIANLDTNFEVATGYLIRMPNSINGTATGTYYNQQSTYVYPGSFTGTPFNGTITKTLNTVGERYTATGNPYASPINVEQFLMSNSAVLEDNTGLYFWRKRNDFTVSSYATLTLAGFVPNEAKPDGTTTPTPGYTFGGQSQAGFYGMDNVSNWIVSQGQGFIVRAKAGASAPLTFTNAMRRISPASGSQPFFKGAAQNSKTSRLYLNLSGANSFSQTAIAYIDGQTVGLDYGYDGVRLSENNGIALYSTVDQSELVIQSRPLFNAADVVPLGYLAPQADQYSIALDHTDGVFAEDQEIYIKDNLLAVTHNIKDGSYSFTSEAGTFKNRFEVVYAKQGALDTDNPVLNGNSVILYQQGNVININSGNAEMTSVTIFDVRGTKIYSQANINTTEVAIANLVAQQQVLIVEINTVQGKVIKKIVY